MHTFFYITFIFGLFFIIDDESVHKSVLYTQSADFAGHALGISLWGIIAIVITVLNTLLIGLRQMRWISISAMLGFLLWFYAGMIYVHNYAWFQLIVGAVPNIFFWGWYYRATFAYRRRFARAP